MVLGMADYHSKRFGRVARRKLSFFSFDCIGKWVTTATKRALARFGRVRINNRWTPLIATGNGWSSAGLCEASWQTSKTNGFCIFLKRINFRSRVPSSSREFQLPGNLSNGSWVEIRRQSCYFFQLALPLSLSVLTFSQNFCRFSCKKFSFCSYLPNLRMPRRCDSSSVDFLEIR